MSKVIIEKSRCGRFFMEQELRFGLDLSRLAVLKKGVWADYYQLLRVVFPCFQEQKNVKSFFKNIVAPALSCIK